MFNCYFSFFKKYLLDEEDKHNERAISELKSFVILWTTTEVIMWFYVGFSYWAFDFSAVGNLGILFSFIHTLAPVVYYLTKSLQTSGLLISLSALAFQVTFCIYNGGIESPSAIWFTAHPVIMSFFGKRKLILLSVLLNIITVLSLVFFGELGAFPFDELPASYTMSMTITSLILLDIVIAFYTVVFINKTKESEAKLSERNEMIENLIRILAHDISNSLVISKLSLEMLKKKVNTPEDMQTLTYEVLQKRIDKMDISNHQIEEICRSTLEWMKASQKKFIFNLETLSSQNISSYLKEYFQDIMEKKELVLSIKKEESFDFFVDEKILKAQIINNIMSNAIKFSPKGGTLFLSVYKSGDWGVVQLEDEGDGIPEDILDAIFAPKKAQSRVGTSGEKGTGFGMSIVKSLVTQMNGLIELKNREGSGTTAIIKFPIS